MAAASLSYLLGGTVAFRHGCKQQPAVDVSEFQCALGEYIPCYQEKTRK